MRRETETYFTVREGMEDFLKSMREGHVYRKLMTISNGETPVFRRRK